MINGWLDKQANWDTQLKPAGTKILAIITFVSLRFSSKPCRSVRSMCKYTYTHVHAYQLVAESDVTTVEYHNKLALKDEHRFVPTNG